MRRYLLALVYIALLSACKGGGGNGTTTANPQADPFVAFVQRLVQTQPEDTEPEDVSMLTPNPADTLEPQAF